MAITISRSVVKGHTARQDVYGRRIVERFHVAGLDPTQSALVQAFNAKDPVSGINIPGMFTPCDFDPLLVCTNIEPRLFAENSRAEVDVDVTWGPVDYSNIQSPVWSYKATTRPVLSAFDVAGKKLQIKYTPGGTSSSSTPIAWNGQVEILKPIGVFQVDQVEWTDPSPKRSYVDCINSVTWQSDPAYTWLCREINITKQLYVAGWRVRYVFEYNPENWLTTIVYHNQFGVIPTDVDDLKYPRKIGATGNGWANFSSHRYADFGPLNLPTIGPAAGITLGILNYGT